MNWQVFTELSSLQVKIHWLAAIVTLVLGLVIVVFRKGTASHKAAGRLYLLAPHLCTVKLIEAIKNSAIVMPVRHPVELHLRVRPCSLRCFIS